MKTLLNLKLLFITVFVINLQSVTLYAQTTTIPDPNFEQALIDLGIDSDGIVNGQVLTSDIENVVILDVSGKQIEDFTGLEDFTALEELDVSYNKMQSLILTGNTNLKILNIDGVIDLSHIDLSNNINLEYLFCQFSSLTVLDLSNNIMLKELILGEGHEINENHSFLVELDLSNNTMLEKFWITETPSLQYINLKSGHNYLLTDVLIYCSIEGYDCGPPFPCAEVDDFGAATTNQPPYNSWYDVVNYSKDCSLANSQFEKESIIIYPNPTTGFVNIDFPGGSEAMELRLLDIQGKLLQQSQSVAQGLDLSDFATGVYFLEIKTPQGKMIKKIVKR